MNPITWQPSRIQTDGEQWAETVFCFIGGPRLTVYSDGSLFDRQAKMSTSRKLRAKLAKHRHSAWKATSTEAARKEPEPEPTESSTAKTQASTQNSHRSLCAHRYSICLLAFATGCRAKIFCRIQFVHLHISELTPGPSGTQRQTTPGTSQSRQPGPQKRGR